MHMGLTLHFYRTELLVYIMRSAATCGFEAHTFPESGRVGEAPLQGGLVGGGDPALTGDCLGQWVGCLLLGKELIT